MSIAAQGKISNTKMAKKYRNRETIINGKSFDSAKEARRWTELQLLQRGGAIQNLQRQVPFELIPAQREPDTTGPRGGVRTGKVLEYPVRYVADFVYVKDGRTVVEDTKGVKTPEYIIKRKLMLWVHGIRILET